MTLKAGIMAGRAPFASTCRPIATARRYTTPTHTLSTSAGLAWPGASWSKEERGVS
jgi:hypothetical protein